MPSNVSIADRSNASSSASTSASASAVQPSVKAFELTKASASLAVGSHGWSPSRSSSVAQAPSPVRASARSASEPRSDWPSEPVVRTRGDQAGVERRHQVVGQLGADSGAAAAEPRQLGEHRRADDVLRDVGAGAGAVREQQQPVERRLVALADGHPLERADAGGQPVHALAPGEQRGGHVAACGDPLAGRRRQPHRAVVAGDGHHVGEGQAVVEDQGVGHGRRHHGTWRNGSPRAPSSTRTPRPGPSGGASRPSRGAGIPSALSTVTQALKSTVCMR